MPSAFASVPSPAIGPVAARGGETFHEAHQWRVKIGGQLQAETECTPVSISVSCGMNHADQAVVVIERAGVKSPFFVNASIRPAEAGQTLEIFDAATGAVKFWGIVEDAEYFFGERMDHKRVVATIQPHHFGDPITDSQYFSVTNTPDNTPAPAIVRVNEPIVFNGWPDGDRHMVAPGSEFPVTGNKSRIRYSPFGPDGKPVRGNCNLFIALDAVQTPRGRQRYAGYYEPFSNAGMWTLRDAVRYLCAVGNTRGLIENPTDADLETLENVILYRTEIPTGLHLTEALDRLLGQYGYHWHVDPNAGAAAGGGGPGGFFGGAANIAINIIQGATQSAKPRIKFVRRGEGPKFEAKYAKPGERADFGTTNIREFRTRYSMAPTVNEIVVLGGRVQLEGTFELQNVTKNKWALNEADEYGELITAPYRPLTDPNKGSVMAVIPSLDQLFPAAAFGDLASAIPIRHIQRRRRFLPCLNLMGTLQTSPGGGVDLRPRGAQNGIEIEIIDRDQDDSSQPSEAAKVWIPLGEHPNAHHVNVRLAEDECAIYFDKGVSDNADAVDQADAFLRSLGEDKRMRVTATIESDLRIQVRVRRSDIGKAPSVQSRPAVFFWDAAERWPCRRINTSGRYASKYGVGAYTSRTPAPGAIMVQMRQFAEALLAGADQATISGQLELMHLDYAVQLGAIVESIAGRGLNLQATNEKAARVKYPQIVAIHHEIEANSTTLTLTAEPDNILEAFA